MIFITKIISVLIGMVVISKTIHDFRKRHESLVMTLFWTLTWLIVIILACFPSIIDRLDTLIGGEGSGLNTFFGATFVFLFFVVYRVYAKANRLERQIHEIVMKIGIKNIEKE